MTNRRYAVTVLLLAFAIILPLTGCGRDQRSHSITVAGSTSVQPFVEMLAEEYSKKHLDMSVNVQGGGSSAGVRAAMAGAAQIGMSSRSLKPGEQGITGIVIAKDAIAVIVHPQNPVTGLDTQTLRRVFTGQITSWQHFGWHDRPITVISREEGSGTRGAFDEMAMGPDEVWPGCLVQDSNGSVRETVAQDRYAIGYISLGLVDRSVKAVPLDGVEPTFGNATSGNYPLVRPFLFVVRDGPEGLVKHFIDFVLGPEGQEILAEEGLIPINARKTH